MEHPLKVAREERGLSQEALEKLSGVSQAAIHRMEAGQVDRTRPVGLFQAMHVARFVGCTVEQLFSADLETWKRDREAKRAAASITTPDEAA